MCYLGHLYKGRSPQKNGDIWSIFFGGGVGVGGVSGCTFQEKENGIKLIFLHKGVWGGHLLPQEYGEL